MFVQDRAKAFYTRHFAGKVAANEKMGHSGRRWIELKFPGAVTNLHFVRRADDTARSRPLVLVDDDVEATIAALKAGGSRSSPEPQERPGSQAARWRNFATARATAG